MRNFLLFFGLLVGYTVLYAGVSRIWSVVTMRPYNSSNSFGA